MMIIIETIYLILFYITLLVAVGMMVYIMIVAFKTVMRDISKEEPEEKKGR